MLKELIKAYEDGKIDKATYVAALKALPKEETPKAQFTVYICKNQMFSEVTK